MSGQSVKPWMTEYVKDILRPRRWTSPAKDGDLVAQALARGATPAAATELRKRLESAQRGESIACAVRSLFMGVQSFRDLLPGATQDDEQREVALALVRQFHVAEEEYRVRFCEPADEQHMIADRFDHFPPQVAFDVEAAYAHGDAGRSVEGEWEEEEWEEGVRPRVDIEVKDGHMSVKVVRTGDARELKVEVDEGRLEAVIDAATRSLRLRSEEQGSSLSPRHRHTVSQEPEGESPTAEAEHDAHPRAPWESDGEDEGYSNVKQEEIEPALGEVLHEEDVQPGFVVSAGAFEDEEPEVKQEEELLPNGYNSDEWLYRDSSAAYPYTNNHAGIEDEDEAEDTYRGPNMNTDDWLYGPGYGASDEELIGESSTERGQDGDDDEDAASLIARYLHAHNPYIMLSDMETMRVDREASPGVDLDSYLKSPVVSSDVSSIRTPSASFPLLPALPPWSPQGPASDPNVETAHRLPHRLDHYPSAPPTFRTPSPTAALPPFSRVVHTPSPPPALPPFAYGAHTPRPSAASYPSAMAPGYDIPSPSTLATSFEWEQAPAVNAAPSAPTSGVQRRRAQRGRGAQSAPYVRPTVDARQVWARSRIHDPSAIDAPVAPFSVPIPSLAHENLEQENSTQFNNIHDDL
ncbi:hypothetical protein WOLCODRAFT_164036 [Wolfiporia cocos MD-104 SS10]|uniref:Uncharacterized protein n=1 Tax=Wolfiporia cocos (strain MD-104) TaxID=742152 RepID=A0A2H3JLQ2_WOLCO|nr:hypothetical protein WOLCODRAFT_164036 [Wolfiporia cocos MD-104 SS10]